MFVNSFVIYNYLNSNEKKTLLDYRREVAQGLIIKKQKIIQAKRKRSTEKQPNTSRMTLQPKRGLNSWSVVNDVRLGNRGTHFVEFARYVQKIKWNPDHILSVACVKCLCAAMKRKIVLRFLMNYCKTNL